MILFSAESPVPWKSKGKGLCGKRKFNTIVDGRDIIVLNNPKGAGGHGQYILKDEYGNVIGSFSCEFASHTAKQPKLARV